MTPRAGRALTIAVVVLLGTNLGGCKVRSVDEQDYTDRNEAILRAVPAYPGAAPQDSYSFGTRDGNGWMENSGPYTAFHTERAYKLPPATTAEQVLGFYRSELDDHWTLQAYTPCETTFRNHHASLFVDACNNSLRLSVDHDAY